MTSKVFIPPSNRPANITNSSTSYTCPSGYYARVMVNIMARSEIYSDGFNNAGEFAMISSDVQHGSYVFWIDEGDSISTAVSAASGTFGPGTGFRVASAKSYVTISVNSTEIARVTAYTRARSY